MPDELAFHPEALREWRTLSAGIKEQFKKTLAERLIEPRLPASKLRGSGHRTKIELLAAGFRLIYEVKDRVVLWLVVAVGQRERNECCQSARPISAEAHAPCPMADSEPLSWMSCAGRTLDWLPCLRTTASLRFRFSHLPLACVGAAVWWFCCVTAVFVFSSGGFQLWSELPALARWRQVSSRNARLPQSDRWREAIPFGP